MSWTDKPAADASPRILNCLPSPAQENDWTFGAAVMAGVADTALPDTVDHRETWWEVGNQGSTGSCVGWAVADGLLRYHFVKAGWIRQQDRLSTRFTWMASKETDEFTSAPTTFIEPEGTSLKAALDVSRKYGAVLDEDLPLNGGRLFPGNAQVFYTKAARLKIASYTNLGPSLMTWRRWLAHNGPILVRLDVDATWFRAKEEPTLRVYRPETGQGGHAVALVGYTPEGFIVRNSWGGDEWGDAGFALATNGYAAAAFTEAYGVSLGGESRVSPGIVRAAAQVSKKKDEPAGTWPERQAYVLAIMLEVVQRAQGRPFGPLSLVSSAFADIASFARFLVVVEGEVGAPGRLTVEPPATLEHLRRGFFDELADWAQRRAYGDVGGAVAAAAAGAVAARIVRDPAATLVIINDVPIPPSVDALNLNPGPNRLRVRIRGAAGDEGTGQIVVGGQEVASATATIRPGMDEAFSATETFNV